MVCHAPGWFSAASLCLLAFLEHRFFVWAILAMPKAGKSQSGDKKLASEVEEMTHTFEHGVDPTMAGMSKFTRGAHP